ncbi:MAG: MBL fold metallo-hydrolase [Candidatus Uhrbacteria bacterium]
MQISWHGLSCFSITTKGPQGDVTAIVDPYDNATGLRFPRSLTADLAMSSHNEMDANNIDALQGNPFVIKSPGEYEVKGIFVYSLPAALKPAKEGAKASPNNIYRIIVEGVVIAHLGALNRELTDTELTDLKDVDILMIPVGGGRVMEPKTAVKVISQIDPRVVMPMTHAIPNLKEKFADVAGFCKEIGVCQREDINKYKVTRSSLPEDETVIMVLSRS